MAQALWFSQEVSMAKARIRMEEELVLSLTPRLVAAAAKRRRRRVYMTKTED